MMKTDTRMVKARDVQPGMVLDLEGDPYVRCDDPDCTMPEIYEYEYGVVDYVELEDVGMMPAVVYLENGDAYGFPRDHELKVAGWRS